MTKIAETDAMVRRRVLISISSATNPDERDLSALTRLYVRDGFVIDGGLVCQSLARCVKIDGGAGALGAAQSVLAGLASPRATTQTAMALHRVKFLKGRVESELRPLRALPGVLTLTLLLAVDSQLRESDRPANWAGLACRLALAGNTAEEPGLLRRDAFHLAWKPAVERGDELQMAERIMDAESWPKRARAAMIRRLWQEARQPWE